MHTTTCMSESKSSPETAHPSSCWSDDGLAVTVEVCLSPTLPVAARFPYPPETLPCDLASLLCTRVSSSEVCGHPHSTPLCLTLNPAHNHTVVHQHSLAENYRVSEYNLADNRRYTIIILPTTTRCITLNPAHNRSAHHHVS